MIKLIGISGSLRSGSYNTALLHAASEALRDTAALEIATLHGIPLYNEDIEHSEGVPQVVMALQEKIASSDGLLLATPEYNNSMPGVLKNAIDWLSRPPSEIPRIFGERPVALVGAAMGGFGTVLSQNAWLPVLRRLGMHPWFGKQVTLSRAHQIFDDSGKMVDEAARKQLEIFLAGFIDFVEASQKIKLYKNI